jgi:hypothetical protein
MSYATFVMTNIGKTKIDIYLVGKTPDGDWAGLKTTSVET